MDVRYHKGFGHGLTPGQTQDLNCSSCQREKAEGQEPNITRYDEKFRLVSCTCPPTDDGSHRTWHFHYCLWAM